MTINQRAFSIFVENSVNVTNTVIKKQFLNLQIITISVNLIFTNVLYTVLNTISNIADNIFGKPLLKKRDQSNKKVTFLG